METVINLDGIRMRLQSPDLDGDGTVGGVETVTQNIEQGITSVVQPTELGDSLKQLNQDEIELVSRMSGIDMRARLHPFEISSVLALDALVSLGVLPTKCLAFTRQKKRLSVSEGGLGRKEIVEIVAGKQERDKQAGGMMGWGKSFLGAK